MQELRVALVCVGGRDVWQVRYVGRVEGLQGCWGGASLGVLTCDGIIEVDEGRFWTQLGSGVEAQC